MSSLLQQSSTRARVIFAGALAGVFCFYQYRRLSRPHHTVKSPSLVSFKTDSKDEADENTVFADYISNPQRLWLSIRRWVVENPRALIFICHGLGEHCGRYDHVALALNKAGYSVYALDHQGHGCSDGDRAFIENFQYLVDDYCQFVRHIQSKFNQDSHPPAFLLGHSMGGGISIMAALQSASSNLWPWNGIILSGPMIAADPAIATPKMRFLARLLSRVVPRVELDKISPDMVSRDARMAQRYAADPLVYHGGMVARSAAELLSACDTISASAGKFNFPFILLQGEEDRLCAAAGARAFFSASPSNDKTLRLYPKLFHEVFNEPERALVLQDMLDWINKHL